MAEGLLARIEAAKQYLDILQEVPYADRDIKHINDVKNAIEHCTQLLEGNI